MEFANARRGDPPGSAGAPRRPRRRRVVRALGGLATIFAFALVAGGFHLRLDKRHVFREVAGELARGVERERVGTRLGTARHVELINHRGETVSSVWIRRPRALAPDYRIVLVYAGRETGRRILDLVPDRSDLVLVAPQYPYSEPEGPLEHLRWPYDVRRAAYRSVAGGLLAVSWLQREERLDPGRLLVVGASLGSAFATIHAALDPRVPRLLIVHGGGDLPLVVRAIEASRGRPMRGRLESALAAVLVDTFDPVHYAAAISPRELVVIGAKGDAVFPTESTLALYRAAREPKSLRWTSGAHVRSRRTAALDDVLREIERVLDEPAPGRRRAGRE